MVLMGDDLRQIPYLVSLGRKTQRTITANIIAALGIKARGLRTCGHGHGHALDGHRGGCGSIQSPSSSMGCACAKGDSGKPTALRWHHSFGEVVRGATLSKLASWMSDSQGMAMKIALSLGRSVREMQFARQLGPEIRGQCASGQPQGLSRAGHDLLRARDEFASYGLSFDVIENLPTPHYYKAMFGLRAR